MALPEKAQLRARYLREREQLDSALRNHANREIAGRLETLPAWRAATTVLVYVSFGAEVETRPILEAGWRARKRMAVPVIAPTLNETPISVLSRLGDLAPGRIKTIFEPAESVRHAIEPAAIDLVLVPGVVFDREGQRLGLGGGYFDRLLAKMPKAIKIGLAYSTQVSPIPLPKENYDVPVQFVLTETALIEVDAAKPERPL
jgi:5-formyltetrahydrofolate cyclo-ligase